jgi:hypothetical protein
MTGLDLVSLELKSSMNANVVIKLKYTSFLPKSY